MIDINKKGIKAFEKLVEDMEEAVHERLLCIVELSKETVSPLKF